MTDRNRDSAATANGRPQTDDLEAIEREHVEQLARAHAELAAAQDRAYWLDRWGLDLNALMRKPGARRLRALLRWLRELQRGKIAVQRYAQARLGDLRTTAAEDDIAAAANERDKADDSTQRS
jgi:hypothetical protein